MNENFCFSENNILMKAKMHVESHTATKEEQLLIKLKKCLMLEKGLDKLYDEAELLDSTNLNELTLKMAFSEFLTACQKLFSVLYPHCGYCDEYVIDIMHEYFRDISINKVSKNVSVKNEPSETFLILDVIRDNMKKEQWYTINEMYDFLKDYPEYKKILKRKNMSLLLDYCVQEGYFIEGIQTYPRGKVGRCFKKTGKEYLDLKTDLLTVCKIE